MIIWLLISHLIWNYVFPILIFFLVILVIVRSSLFLFKRLLPNSFEPWLSRGTSLLKWLYIVIGMSLNNGVVRII